ncbi:MAG TPA: hypothetical protein VGY13_01475 [Solirubrobacteraceae bacterium]|jgi:hypothetical protein|nr:hypothetical protein [Solirubrobacteraceae bacterium]
MSMLPSVRAQLQDAAVRASRPERSRARTVAWRAGAPALAASVTALLAWTLAGPTGTGVRATRPHAQSAAALGTLAAASTRGRLRQAAYLQSASAPALGSVTAPVSARALADAGAGRRILVSFVARRPPAGARGVYSAFARGPRGTVLTAPVPSAGAERGLAGRSLAVQLGAPGAGRLAPGLYRGMVVFTYAVDPTLLEDSETVLLPVGSFHVRVP